MNNYDSTNLEFVQQLRGLIDDEADKRLNFGTALKVTPSGVDVAVGSTGNILRNLPAIGGSTAVTAGAKVYLLYFDQQPVVLGMGDFSNLDVAATSQSAGDTGRHTHHLHYYTKSQVNSRLALRAPLSHDHTPSHIEAESGTIGGWDIDEFDLSNAYAFLSARGFVSFGDAPPETYGNNVGAWLGIDMTDSLAKMSLYSDASHYLQFDGSDIILSGTIYAQAGEFQGSVQVGTGSPHILIDGANALIKTSDFLSGSTGWQVESDGTAEFYDIKVRGTISAVVFSYGQIQANAGTLGIFKSSGKLILANLSVPSDYQIDVEDPETGHAALFALNDILRIKTLSRDVWLQVNSLLGGIEDMTTHYRYHCSLLDGTWGALEAGIPVVDYGTSGTGFITLSADNTASIANGAEAPNIMIATHAGDPWDTCTPRVVIGNMKPHFGAAAADYGIGIGEYITETSGNWLRYTQGTGFKLVAGNGAVIIDDDGIGVNIDAVWDVEQSVHFNDTSGNLVGYFAGNDDGVTHVMVIQADGSTQSMSGRVQINSISENADSSSVHLEAFRDSAASAGLSLTNDGVLGTHLAYLYADQIRLDGTIDTLGSLSIDSNAGMLSLYGSDHCYIQFFPDGSGAGRKGYMGFSSSANDHVTIGAEAAAANIRLITNSGNVAITGGLTVSSDTTGTKLILDQGAADGGILELRSSDVTHGVTTIADTNSYGLFQKVSATAGGTYLRGLSEATIGLMLNGINTTDDTAKTTAATAPVVIVAEKKNGTGLGGMTVNSNLLAIRAPGPTTRFIFDTEGDSHQDVGTAWTNFDDHDDVALLTALSAGVSAGHDPLKTAFQGLLEEHRDTLERNRIVTFNPDGHHFINWSRTHMLEIGAIRQLGQIIQRLEARIQELEQRYGLS